MAEPTTAASLPVVDIPLREIYADPSFNCRGVIAPHDVQQLMKNIKDLGLLQPIVVQPRTYVEKPNVKYRVVAGHRRYEAIKRLEWPTIPATVRDDLTDDKARIINLKENIERRDLNILQEAMALAPFKHAGWVQEDVARELSVSKGWVQPRWNLLELEPEIQSVAAAGLITQDQIKDIFGLPTREQRFDAVRQIKDAKLRGEKSYKLAKKRRKDPIKRKKRDPGEILEINSWLYDQLGPGLATRALAWAAGEISDLDLIRDVKAICEEKDKPFKLPESYEKARLIF